MLVVAKTPPIRVEIFGEGMAELVAVLKKAIPGVSITPEPDFEDDEFVKPDDIPWFREINISAIENGKRSVGPRTAKKLAAALDIDYHDLL